MIVLAAAIVVSTLTQADIDHHAAVVLEQHQSERESRWYAEAHRQEHERVAVEAAERAQEAPRAVPATVTATGTWDRLAACESEGRWNLNTGNGYYGGVQFSAATWRQAGGTGLPHQHSRETQIAVAESWLAKTSWSQWPTCSRKIGVR